MKPKLLFFLFLSAMLFIALKPHGGDKNSGQAPLGRTGAPGETTCGGCHAGGSYSGSMTFELGAENASEYVPGETYVITFSGEYDAPRYGFSITALDDEENPAGDFALINESNTSFGALGNGRQYVGHRAADATNEWIFEWTAPDMDAGPITFYYVINATNGDGSPGGDYVETGSTSIQPFEEPETFSLNLVAQPATGGTTEGEGDYEAGETVTVSANPNEGYQFLYWTDEDNNELSNQESFEFVMPAEDVTLIANFSFKTYIVTFVIEDEAGETIPDAIITFDGDVYDAGFYVFEDLPPASYEYTVSKEGYFDNSGSIELVDEDVSITVVLESDETTIAEWDNADIVSIFPNPSINNITIRTSHSAMEEIMIFDLQAKVVYHEHIETNEHSVDVSTLNPAIYLLQIHTADQVSTHRIFVQP